MNRCIKKSMLFLGIATHILVYAAEKTSESVDARAAAQAQLEDKVARYFFSGHRPIEQPNNLHPVDNKLSQDKPTQYFSFRYTKQPARALKSATVHAHLENSLREQ